MTTTFDNFCNSVNLLVVLDHSGRSGNGFFQTIFDQHPQVLTCPWVHYVFSYVIHHLGTSPVSAAAARHFLLEESYLQWVWKAPEGEVAAFIRKIGGDPKAKIDRTLVLETIDEALKQLAEPISAHDIVCLLYFAYGRGAGRDLRDVRYILTSDSISLRTETVRQGFSGQVIDFIINQFPSARIVHLVRDPRAGFASSNHQFVNQLGNMYGLKWGNYWPRMRRLLRCEFDWDSVFVFGFWLMYFRETFLAIEKKKAEHPKPFLFVFNEDLNQNFMPTVQRLAAELDVDVLDSWNTDFVPTMVGKPWTGAGAYNSAYQQHVTGPLRNDSREVSLRVTGPNDYVIQRWRERLGRNEVFLTEWLFREELKLYGYEPVIRRPTDGFWREMQALWCPMRGELPTVQWIRMGGSLLDREFWQRIFYGVSFAPFYVMARLMMMRVIYNWRMFDPRDTDETSPSNR